MSPIALGLPWATRPAILSTASGGACGGHGAARRRARAWGLRRRAAVIDASCAPGGEQALGTVGGGGAWGRRRCLEAGRGEASVRARARGRLRVERLSESLVV